MQTSTLRSTLASLTECPICCETYTVTNRKPKLLTPCGHTLCLECGIAYCRHKVASNPGDRIVCPVCRRNVRLPAGGFAALSNNLTMMKLMDARDVMTRRESEVELRSALDVVDGLLACERRLQGAVNEIENIREAIQAVLFRRQATYAGEPHTTLSVTKLTSLSPWATTTTIAAAATVSTTSPAFPGLGRSSTPLVPASSRSKSASTCEIASTTLHHHQCRLQPGCVSMVTTRSEPSQLVRRNSPSDFRSTTVSNDESANQLTFSLSSAVTPAIQLIAITRTLFFGSIAKLVHRSLERWKQISAATMTSPIDPPQSSIKSSIFVFFVTIFVGISLFIIVQMWDVDSRKREGYEIDEDEFKVARVQF